MKTKRFFLKIAAALVLVSAAMACTVDEGGSRPSETRSEIAVYYWICGMNHWAACDGVYTAAGLNEYLRQTTDEGREAVRSRYFPGVRIEQAADGGWVFESSEKQLKFVIEGGRLLGEENASWRMSGRGSYPIWNQPITGTFTTEGDRIRCNISCTDTGEGRTETVDWLVAATASGDDDIRMEIEGSGRIDIVRRFDFGADKWRLEYRIGKPMIREDRGREVSGGKLSVTAVLTGSEERRMEFEAEHRGVKDVKITVGGGSE